MLLGALYGVGLLAILTIGLPLLLLAVVGSLLLAKKQPPRATLFGLVAGLGFPMFYLALLNRGGPGTVCTTTATGESCADESNPWLWLVIGFVLLAGGVAGFIIHPQRDQAPG
ncbi:MAG: hypothetical protein M3130_07625 [Actinomycetota bacterium]|nr:hypothetical protein [Actinomycetota bacterium]